MNDHLVMWILDEHDRTEQAKPKPPPRPRRARPRVEPGGMVLPAAEATAFRHLMASPEMTEMLDRTQQW